MAMLFPMGRIVATPGALAALEQLGVEHAARLLRRHLEGDWTEMDAEDRRHNREAVADGSRVFSAYTVDGTRFYVITEADRSATTILLPEEY